MAAPIPKIQLFGHSFICRLRDFISGSDQVRFDLSLSGPPLIQYTGFPGASVQSLRDNIEDVLDFQPDIVILCVGTNDIYDARVSPRSVAQAIMDLVDTLLFVHNVSSVIVLQVLHRCRPTGRTRYPVDVDWFNSRVDELNMLLIDGLNTTAHHRSYLWRMKGFWSQDCKARHFAADGCHLSDSGQLRFLANIRAAVVAALKKSICCH